MRDKSLQPEVIVFAGPNMPVIGEIFVNLQQPTTTMMMITILGPTASGKTPVAVAVARQAGGEIISADSRQVYRRMDIGTGKDLAEYGDVPFHLTDISEPGTQYNVHRGSAKTLRKHIRISAPAGRFPSCVEARACISAQSQEATISRRENLCPPVMRPGTCTKRPFS